MKLFTDSYISLSYYVQSQTLKKKQKSDSGNMLLIKNIFIPVYITDRVSQHPHYYPN